MPPDYNASFDLYIAKARNYAQEGDMVGMGIALTNARICAQVCNLNIAVWQTEIELCGYTNAIPQILKRAEQSALEGKLNDMNETLKDAQFYATQIGQDITPQIIRIQQWGYN